MDEIQTERLVIRNFQSSDAEALREMILQYTASELAVYDYPWPTSLEKIKEVTDWFAGGNIFLAVCLKESIRFIGFVSLNPEEKPDVRQYNLGYIFNFDYHGQGYASEACRAVVKHAFSKLQAGQIISGTAAVNLPSRRVLEKLGFHMTAETNASFQNGPDGQPIEFQGLIYTLTKADWHSN